MNTLHPSPVSRDFDLKNSLGELSIHSNCKKSKNEYKKNSKILAIDDDEIFLEILLTGLEENGFQAIGARDGWLGLQLAKEQIPDIMICDLKMPGLDGYEVLKAVRQDPMIAQIPFIFLTSEQSQTDRCLAKKLGADDYLDKFFTFEQLIEVIETQLRSTLRSNAHR
jgi:DNA-binding response OmpR family regulator